MKHNTLFAWTAWSYRRGSAPGTASKACAAARSSCSDSGDVADDLVMIGRGDLRSAASVSHAR